MLFGDCQRYEIHTFTQLSTVFAKVVKKKQTIEIIFEICKILLTCRIQLILLEQNGLLWITVTAGTIFQKSTDFFLTLVSQ